MVWTNQLIRQQHASFVNMFTWFNADLLQWKYIFFLFSLICLMDIKLKILQTTWDPSNQHQSRFKLKYTWTLKMRLKIIYIFICMFKKLVRVIILTKMDLFIQNNSFVESNPSSVIFFKVYNIHSFWHYCWITKISTRQE